MRKLILLFAFILALTLTTENLFAQRGGRGQEIEVKIGSPLPRESLWGRTLDKIAAEWSRVTNGQVRLRVLHGGIEGSEAKMQLSLSSNTIQAAVFTSFGLSAIDPGIMTLSAPFLIRTEAELDAVMKELQPVYENRINSGDYFMLAWSKAGFVNIFTKEPVMTPDDLKKIKIASNAEAGEMNTAFKTMGYQVVEADLGDIGQKIATGAVSALYNNPAGIAAFQLHTVLKNMLSVNIAPVVGGIIVNQVTWKRIGELNPMYQAELLRVTRQIAENLDASMQKTVSDAVQAMSREGLRVNRPSPVQEQLWFNDVERVTPVLLGSTYNRDLYNRINAVLERYRKGQ